MSRVATKRAIIKLLQDQNLAVIMQGLLQFPESGLLNSLFSCLCHADEQVRWHAVSGFGFIVPKIAEGDLEKARIVMRRFLWMLNDESGGIGWGVPEAMGEVMYHHRRLAEEYLHMLVSYTAADGPEQFQDGNFLELELLQQGVLWGLCRVAPRYREMLLEKNIGDNLGLYFDSPGSQVRGLVCRLAGSLRLSRFLAQLSAASGDQAPFRYYAEGVFNESEVAAEARHALALIKQQAP
jgi:hypothetical protein